jgi:hypothetical protein
MGKPYFFSLYTSNSRCSLRSGSVFRVSGFTPILRYLPCHAKGVITPIQGFLPLPSPTLHPTLCTDLPFGLWILGFGLLFPRVAASPRPGFSPPPCPESRRWRDRRAPLSLSPPPEVVGQRKPDQSPTLRSPTPSGITPTRTDKTPAPINPKMASPLVSAERPIRLANSL